MFARLILLFNVSILILGVNGFQIRLVNVSGAHRVDSTFGHVQVFLNGTWCFLSDQNLKAAKVHAACEQLGFRGRALNYQIRYYTHAVAGKIVALDGFVCRGDEKRLSNCSYKGWRYVNPRTRSYYVLAWIQCKPNPKQQPKCEHKEIMLAGYTDRVHYGILQQKYKGESAITMHVKNWEDVHGKKACLQLGFPGFIKNLRSQEFYNGLKKANFACGTTGEGLNCCPIKSNDMAGRVGLICEPAIRLAGFNQYNNGSLQLYRNKSWRYVCGDQWTGDNTQVVCRQLGYEDVTKVRHYLVLATAQMDIWQNNTICVGAEKNVRRCISERRTNSVCKSIVQIECEGKGIRLVGFDSLHGGRVEILHKGLWGMVTDDSIVIKFAFNEAKVACRELGYHDAVRTLLYGETPELTKNVLWLTDVRCKGNESSLWECQNKKFLRSTEDKTYPYKIGVLCKRNIRLDNLKSANEGILQVYSNKSWRYVCSDQWTSKEKKVSCNELGYSTATDTTNMTPTVNKPDYLTMNIRCAGQEKTLSRCSQERRQKDDDCAGNLATVRCKDNEGDVKVAGELQIKHEGIWGLVSGKGWTKENAKVVCRQLGSPAMITFKEIRQPIRFANTTADGEHTIIWLSDVSCTGNEKRLLDCPKYSWINSRKDALRHLHTRVAIECEKSLKLSSGNQGALERFINETWKPLCANKKLDIRELCQELGYSSGTKLPGRDCASKCGRGTELCVECFKKYIRITNKGGLPYSGFVEVYDKRRKKWFRVIPQGAPRGWVDRNKKQICRFLGYPGAKKTWHRRTKELYPVTAVHSWNEKIIYHRPSATYGALFAGITCMKDVNISRNGTVKIYWEDKWRILSDMNWTKKDGDVVCHNLGKVNARVVEPYTFNSSNNMSSLIIDFKCKCDETTLKDCPYYKEDVYISSVNNRAVKVLCDEAGQELCKECKCGNITVNCSEQGLQWMPWTSENFTGENVVEYLLSGNSIARLDKIHFQEFMYLEKLDLSRNRLSELPDDLFGYTIGLIYLNLSGNRIETINVELLKNLKSLTTLDISKNNIQTFNPRIFHELGNLSTLSTDRFTLCCHANMINPNIKCIAPEDVFSNCEKLLKNDFLEVFIWIVAIFIILGNLTVVFFRVCLKEGGLQSWFIGSLVVSDTLMFVYLVIVAYNNVVYRGNYFEYDKEWRSSTSCTVAGVMSLLSSQVSLFVITAVTSERCYSIVYAIKGHRRLGTKASITIVLVAWTIGGTLAICPAVLNVYFNTEFLKFYGQNSVCLPLQLPEEDREVLGWEYCLGLFGFLNVILCVYVTLCYIIMYVTLKRNNVDRTAVRDVEDSHISKRMFGIVVTNLSCWLPVTVFTYLSLRGFGSEVRALHAWTAVCLFPINAALNPAIYTFFAPTIWQRLRGIYEEWKSPIV